MSIPSAKIRINLRPHPRFSIESRSQSRNRLSRILAFHGCRGNFSEIPERSLHRVGGDKKFWENENLETEGETLSIERIAESRDRQLVGL